MDILLLRSPWRTRTGTLVAVIVKGIVQPRQARLSSSVRCWKTKRTEGITHFRPRMELDKSPCVLMRQFLPRPSTPQLTHTPWGMSALNEIRCTHARQLEHTQTHTHTPRYTHTQFVAPVDCRIGRCSIPSQRVIHRLAM